VSFWKGLLLRLAICLLVAGLGETGSAILASSTSARVDLTQRRLDNVKIRTTSIEELFSRLALVYEVPIGLEIARNDDLTAIYSLDLRHGTVVDLLNQFVASHEQYAWKIESGVVSVFPKDKNRDVVLAELLATELPSFSVKEKTSCWALGDALVATPEIRRILEANRMTYSAGYIGGFYIQQLGQHFTLNVSKMTLKSILDKVVKESPVAKIWIVKRDSSEETLLLRLNARLENAPKNNLKGDFVEIDTDELPER
jgi:hypothetical protein